MPYFRTIIRGIDRTLLPTGKIQETPKQRMGFRIQLPGHERYHRVEPGTGRRIFPPVNKTADGPLKLIFEAGVCFIPDPETATDKEFTPAHIGSREVAKVLLDFAVDKDNGYYGIDYEFDPNDRDGYWKARGEVVENPQIVKEYVTKDTAAKIEREVKKAVAAGVSDSSESISKIGTSLGEGLQQADAKRRPGRPRVSYGARTTGDQI